MKKNNKTGIIIVISAPSGTGKTTIIKELLKKCRWIKRSVSITTRKARAKEKNKRDYFFVSKEKFTRMIREHKFIEWAKVLGYYYGTSREQIGKIIQSGYDAILNIDVQGASNVKKKEKNAVLIFVQPPSFKELKRRLVKRGQDSPDAINKRLKLAKKEMTYIKLYDYTVVNDNLKRAVENIMAIITAEKSKVI